MKAFRSILFALVLPAAACGGGGETPKIDTSWTPGVPTPKTDNKVAKPFGDEPKVVTPAPLPTKYDELLALGTELVGKGEFGRAKEALEAAIKLDKKKAEPHIEMARMYIAMNEKGLAVASAKKAIKLAPTSSLAWNTKGRAELTAHNYDNAIEAFSKACELNQDNAFAWNNLGYTELLLKKYEDAAEHLIEATSKKGATGYMFNNLGTALEHLDRLDEARTAYEAGGKLGSKEAVASRKRLEGVDSIAVAKVEEEDKSSTVKEYELTDEGDVTDEEAKPVEEEVDEKIETKVDETKVEEAKVEEAKVEEPAVDEPSGDEPVIDDAMPIE